MGSGYLSFLSLADLETRARLGLSLAAPCRSDAAHHRGPATEAVAVQGLPEGTPAHTGAGGTLQTGLWAAGTNLEKPIGTGN